MGTITEPGGLDRPTCHDDSSYVVLDISLLRLGGGWAPSPFDDEFYDWWSRQVIDIEDHPYAGIEFSRDEEMVVLPGSRLRAIGKYFIVF